MAAPSHCCNSMASSGFSAISCSDITRFRAQIRPVQNYAFLKEDPHPSASANFRVHVSLLISRILADLHPQADASAISTALPTCAAASVKYHLE